MTTLEPEVVGRTPGILRFSVAATTVIPAAYRSWSIFVVAAASTASPTLNGVAIPVGATIEYTAPDDETMRGATLVTVTGDDVVFTSVL